MVFFRFMSIYWKTSAFLIIFISCDVNHFGLRSCGDSFTVNMRLVCIFTLLLMFPSNLQLFFVGAVFTCVRFSLLHDRYTLPFPWALLREIQNIFFLLCNIHIPFYSQPNPLEWKTKCEQQFMLALVENVDEMCLHNKQPASTHSLWLSIWFHLLV